VELLREARDAICGGNIGFVATVNKFGVVVASPDVLEDRASTNYETTYVYNAFRELITSQDNVALADRFGDEHSLSAISVGLEGAQFSLDGNRRMNVEEATSFWNYGCDDVHELGRPYQAILADAIGHASTSASCEDAKAFCSHDSIAGVKSRQICPQTCGCRNAASSLVLYSDSQGCPSSCKWQSDYKLNLQTRSCLIDQPINSTDWSDYFKGVTDFRESYPVSWRILVTRLMEQLKKHGCGALKEGGIIPDGGSWPVDFCAETNTYNLKPLRYMCPVACKCATAKNKYLCPGTCAEHMQSGQR
jgi:hypothetical protein